MQPDASHCNRRRSRRLLPGLAVALLSWPLYTAAQPVPSVLRIDPAHSHADFAVRLIWWQKIHGHFDDVRGDVQLDRQRHTVRVHAHIAVASVRVRPARYRTPMLGKDFFDVARDPDIQFVSRPVASARLRHRGTLRGALTLHGQTRDVTFQIEDALCSGDGLGSCTLLLQGHIDRTRFGMLAHRTLVSRHVALKLRIRLRPDTTPAAPASTPQPAPRLPADDTNTR